MTPVLIFFELVTRAGVDDRTQRLLREAEGHRRARLIRTRESRTRVRRPAPPAVVIDVATRSTPAAVREGDRRAA
jgi:hypothetical protein